MKGPVTDKQELQERISSLEVAVILLLNSLRRRQSVEIDEKKYNLVCSISDKELDVIERLITRPNRF